MIPIGFFLFFLNESFFFVSPSLFSFHTNIYIQTLHIRDFEGKEKLLQRHFSGFGLEFLTFTYMIWCGLPLRLCGSTFCFMDGHVQVLLGLLGLATLCDNIPLYSFMNILLFYSTLFAGSRVLCESLCESECWEIWSNTIVLLMRFEIQKNYLLQLAQYLLLLHLQM